MSLPPGVLSIEDSLLPTTRWQLFKQWFCAVFHLTAIVEVHRRTVVREIVRERQVMVRSQDCSHAYCGGKHDGRCSASMCTSHCLAYCKGVCHREYQRQKDLDAEKLRVELLEREAAAAEKQVQVERDRRALDGPTPTYNRVVDPS